MTVTLSNWCVSSSLCVKSNCWCVWLISHGWGQKRKKKLSHKSPGETRHLFTASTLTGNNNNSWILTTMITAVVGNKTYHSRACTIIKQLKIWLRFEVKSGNSYLQHTLSLSLSLRRREAFDAASPLKLLLRLSFSHSLTKAKAYTIQARPNEPPLLFASRRQLSRRQSPTIFKKIFFKLIGTPPVEFLRVLTVCW